MSLPSGSCRLLQVAAPSVSDSPNPTVPILAWRRTPVGSTPAVTCPTASCSSDHVALEASATRVRRDRAS
nr:hypothetical protein [uncultured Actinomyces sp.]